jgi:hypothetical protein
MNEMVNIDDKLAEKIESLTDTERKRLIDVVYCDIQECIRGVCEEWNRDLTIL